MAGAGSIVEQKPLFKKKNIVEQDEINVHSSHANKPWAAL